MHFYTVTCEVYAKTKLLAVASGNRIARKVNVQTNAELRRPEVRAANVAFRICTGPSHFPRTPSDSPSSLPAPGSYSTRRAAAGCSGKSEETNSPSL